MSEEDRGEIILVNGLRPLIEVQGGAYRVTDNQGFGDLLLYEKRGSGYSPPTSLSVPFFLERKGLLYRCEGMAKERSGRANLYVKECMPEYGHAIGLPFTKLSPEELLQGEAGFVPVEAKKGIDMVMGWMWKFVFGHPQTVRSARALHPVLADLSPDMVFSALSRTGTMIVYDGVIAFADQGWLEVQLKFAVERGIFRQKVYLSAPIDSHPYLLWVIKS